jgi:hypothetical protein
MLAFSSSQGALKGGKTYTDTMSPDVISKTSCNSNAGREKKNSALSTVAGENVLANNEEVLYGRRELSRSEAVYNDGISAGTHQRLVDQVTFHRAKNLLDLLQRQRLVCHMTRLEQRVPVSG